MQPEPENRVIRLRDCQQGDFLSVRGLDAQVSIDGPFASTTLRIRFANDLARTIEGDLVFPLPPFAALSQLSVRCGGRTLQGKIRPRQRAQAEYARAVQAGQTAALGESEGEDLSRLRIAPIEKGEDVEVTLTLVHALVPIADGHRLLLPLTYMPRFIEDEARLKDTERAAKNRPRPLTLAARATIKIDIREGKGGPPKVRCTSHSTRIESEKGHTVLLVGPAPLDRDLHLEIADRAQGQDPTLWLRHDPTEGPDGMGPTTAVAVLPPAFADEGPTVPRTVTLLVDRSGSMNGGPMEAAIRAVRGCLRGLTPADRFNIIAFDNVLEVLAQRPVPFTDSNLRAADAFIGGIQARGGTSASMAITAALTDVQTGAQSVALQESVPGDAAHRLRLVVFMTDGDVAGAEQVLTTAKEKLVDTRLHVIGIGHSVHHGMLAQLATLGGGTYTPVATDEDLERALGKLKNAIDAPLWTGVRISLRSDGDVRAPRLLEPQGALDLFAGQPLLLAFRGPLLGNEELVLEGQRQGGQDLRLVTPLKGAAGADDKAGQASAATLWALLKNRRLTYRFNPEDDLTLESLGVAFGLVNRQVALVAVHEDQRNVTVEASVPVSLPLPANLAQPSPPPMMQTLAGAVYSSMAMPGAPPPAPASGALPFAGPPPAAQMSMRPSSPARPAVLPSAPSAAAPAKAKKASVIGRAKGALKDLFHKGGPSAPDMGGAPPAPAMEAADLPADEQGTAPLSDDEAGLRALLLHQGADGLFDGDLGATLAAVAVLVGRGHTSREGLFRAELRRTLQTLRGKLAGLAGDERTLAALALALLILPGGEPSPAELPVQLAAMLAGLSVTDLPAARAAIHAALAAAPKGWQQHTLARSLQQVFALS